MSLPMRFPLANIWIPILAYVLVSSGHVLAQQVFQTDRHIGPACLVIDRFFADQVWTKVGERTCLKCHNVGGDAADSEFLLRDTASNRAQRTEALQHNHSAFAHMATTSEHGSSRLLQKVRGELDHGGGEVLQADSTGYRILERFVRRANGQTDEVPPLTDYDAASFFEGLRMLPPQQLLRRVTLSLAGRLPTASEQATVDADGLSAMDTVLDNLMREDAFYERLQEAFNDILLTEGYEGGGESALSYTHFHKSRLWYQQRDPNKDRSKADRLPYSHPDMIAYTKLVRDYRQALRREPVEMVSYIVRNERPFTEIVTADYVMVSPYTARGYGIYDELRDRFNDPEAPFEYIPTRLQALTEDGNGRVVQDSETGFYPHAGLLSTFQYLKRYPTTETNRNRLRVRMVFQHFLGVDLLQLAPRVNDAAASTSQYEIPTMQAADCVVCHKTMDPIAGLFQDFYVVDGKGIYGPRKDGWYEDMFAPGLEGEPLPAEEKWRALQWLGERTAADPRFAVAMVNHVWYVLTGRQSLQPPEDIDDPLFDARRRAYLVQRDEIERVADRFAQSNFNLKVVFKELVRSPFYRADGLETAIEAPQRLAELEDIGIARLLTPEQLERKLTAIFGTKWGRLTDPESKFNILYGGIDYQEITERNTEPSGAMGAIQRILANEIACKNVAADFARPATERRLFPGIEPDVVPGSSDEADSQIRLAIVQLHQRLLGRHDAPDAPEVQRSFELFAGIIADAQARDGIEPTESYYCQTQRDSTPRDPDPHYTIRAWRAVVTYLLRQHEFLYE